MASEEEIKKKIPVDVTILSHTSKASSKAQGSKHSKKPGATLTSAFLGAVYKDNEESTEENSWSSVLQKMEAELNEKSIDQIPNLASSRLVDMGKPMKIFPNGVKKDGVKRAILVGISYAGQEKVAELSGCHQAVKNMREYLVKVEGFLDNNVLVLLDDGVQVPPTRKNIKQAFLRMAKTSKPGDSAFIHYVGHGSRLLEKSENDNENEDYVYVETILPSDFQKNGHISGNTLLKSFIGPTHNDVTIMMFIDCCDSGEVVSLPYRTNADGDGNSEMQLYQKFEMPKYSFEQKQSCLWEVCFCVGGCCGLLLLTDCGGCDVSDAFGSALG